MLETLGLEEAAQLARMHPATLRAQAAAGKAPGAKPGKEWVFITADLLDWIRSGYKQEVQAPCRSTSRRDAVLVGQPLSLR